MKKLQLRQIIKEEYKNIIDEDKLPNEKEIIKIIEQSTLYKMAKMYSLQPIKNTRDLARDILKRITKIDLK